MKSFFGERGIRTLAGVAPTNDLANRPLQPLGYFSITEVQCLNTLTKFIIYCKRYKIFKYEDFNVSYHCINIVIIK